MDHFTAVRSHVSLRRTFLIFSLILMSHAIGQTSDFVDHGIVVPISESRVLITATGPEREPLVINLIEDSVPKGTATSSSRVSLLIHDINSGSTEQYYPAPDNLEPESIFTALVSSAHKLYFNRCNAFDEFDLKTRTFTFQSPNVGGYMMSLAEGRDGEIYFATYPESWLNVYEPGSGKITRLVRLDPKQQYPTRMAIDAEGWLYIGIGTEKSNLVAYNPTTGEMKELVAPADRNKNDAGSVIVDEKGTVFGRGSKLLPWSRLLSGQVYPAPGFTPESIRIPKNSIYYMSSVTDLPDGAKIDNYSMKDRSFDYVSAGGERKTLSFDYETNGASIGSMIQADNGKLYGSTHHPMVLWEYDIAAQKAHILGSLPRIGGGCLTKFASWHGQLISNSYARGDFYTFDPSKPFQESAPEENPTHLLRTEPLISRPHTILRYPDSPLIISAGWPSYGLVGGGMLIYDMERREKVALLDAASLVPGHSITSMAIMPDGNIAFGTSALALGGAHSNDDSAKLGIFSWKLKKVTWTQVPVQHSDYIVSICMAREDLLYGITHDSVFFVFDLSTRKVLARHQIDPKYLFPAANRGDNALVKLPDGRVLLSITKAIFEIDPARLEPILLVEPPVPIFETGVVADHRLYFSSTGHLWSYAIPAKK